MAQHDIKNLINGAVDISKRLIQVKQILFPLMDNKMETITAFLVALLQVIKKNSTLGEGIALCNNSNMALQNMYNTISNHGETTKEKEKN